jgi:hypothetical protein
VEASIGDGNDINISGAFHAPVLGKGTQNIINVTPDAVDHMGCGINSLQALDYPSAAQHFRQRLGRCPNDAAAHYYLGIAMLGGRNPCDHYVRTLDLVVLHLQEAASLDSSLHCAKVAALLLHDATIYRWGRNKKSLSRQDMDLIGQVSTGRARELTCHIPAPESIWWTALSKRSNQGNKRGK